MKGQGKFKKLTKGWEKFVMKDLLNDFLTQWPTTEGLTQKRVAQLLVRSDWIEKLQRYTWRSARLSGVEISYDDFKDSLTKYLTYEGTTINAWSNSHVRPVAAKLTKRVKKHTRILNQRLTKLADTDDIDYVIELLGTIDKPKKGIKKKARILKRDFENLSQVMKAKRLNELKDYIKEDITTNQYKAVVVDSFDKVNNFQGKRIAQDQLQSANNDVLGDKQIELKEEVKKNSKLTLVGFWTLSPTHKFHQKNDPCEKHASADAGYGKGSHTGTIPIPVKDSHFGCKCKVVLKVI